MLAYSLLPRSFFSEELDSLSLLIIHLFWSIHKGCGGSEDEDVDVEDR